MLNFASDFLCIFKELKKVLDFMFPQTCIICGKLSKDYICEVCEKRFNKYKENGIIDNKKMIMDKLNIHNINLKQNYYLVEGQKIYWEKMIYCFNYKSIVRKYILQYKFFGKVYLSRFFSYQILKNPKINQIFKNYDIIIPVPMDKIKKAKRGYNQAELITNIISKSGLIKSDNTILEKAKKSKTQSTLKKEERKNNVENAYVVKQTYKVKNRKIIIFDDIYTTGATVNEISKKLKIAGATEVMVLVIAKD